MEDVIDNPNPEFIKIIYESVLDEGFWPDILHGLAKEIDRLDGDTVFFPKKNEQGEFQDKEKQAELALIDKILPYFKQAFELNKQYSTVLAKNEALNALLDTMPIGIILIDNNLNVLSFNHSAKTMLLDKDSIGIEQQKLTVANSRSSALIKQYISSPSENKELQKLLLSSEKNNSVLSVLIAPYKNSNFQFDRRYYALFLKSTDLEIKLSYIALNKEFNISRAEGKLINALVNGKTIGDYARDSGLSENTLRTQLRSVFKKTNVNRLPQLVKLILTNPSYLFRFNKQDKKITIPTSEINNQILILKDGRKLVYSIDGVENGKVIIFLHGKYGCRLLKHPDSNIAKDANVQVLTLDRPGYGQSDPQSFPSFLNWTEDLVQLLDHRNIEQCSIIGLETGSAYAMASAYKYPERIKKILLCNPYAPNMRLADFSSAMPVEKLFFALAKYTPSLFRNFSELRFKGMTGDLNWYYEKLTRYLPECDRALLARQDFLEMLHRNGIESLRDPVGFINDMLSICKDWGFELGDIKTKVEIWQGMQNRYIPVSISTKLSTYLPQASHFLLPNQGHFFAIPYWNVLLYSALDESQPTQYCWIN